MARVYHRKAMKDYPQYKIAKGEMYYYTKIKTGPRSSKTMRSKTPFKPSQLTSSDFLQRLYSVDEMLGEGFADKEALVSTLEDAISQLEELRDEQQEKLDNMPDGLRDGDTGNLLQERYDALDSYISELEDVKNDAESLEDKEREEDEDDEDDELASVVENLHNVLGGHGC